MTVREQDLRHIADLARLAVPEGSVAPLLRELNEILRHMDVLAAVEVPTDDSGWGADGARTAARRDAGPPIPLATALERFAPEMRDGFFLVPRLASHDDGSEAPADPIPA